MQGPPFEAGFCFLGAKHSRRLMTRASVRAWLELRQYVDAGPIKTTR